MKEKKSLSQLQNEKVKKLLELGEIVHSKTRRGEIKDSEITEISKEISLLDKEVFESFNDSKENHCPKCNEKLEEGSKFCSNCGTNISEYFENETKKCQLCGGLTSKESKFCMVCGSKME